MQYHTTFDLVGGPVGERRWRGRGTGRARTVLLSMAGDSESKRVGLPFSVSLTTW